MLHVGFMRAFEEIASSVLWAALLIITSLFRAMTFVTAQGVHDSIYRICYTDHLGCSKGIPPGMVGSEMYGRMLQCQLTVFYSIIMSSHMVFQYNHANA